jgi:hypothetical protein
MVTTAGFRAAAGAERHRSATADRSPGKPASRSEPRGPAVAHQKPAKKPDKHHDNVVTETCDHPDNAVTEPCDDPQNGRTLSDTT